MSYTKTLLTKNVPNDTSPCSKFFSRGRNPKNDRDTPKKPSFLTKKWKSSYTKTLLTKNVPNDTSQCSKFFFRGRNPKNDQDRPKKPSFLTKKCGKSVFSLKIFKLTLLENFLIFHNTSPRRS